MKNWVEHAGEGGTGELSLYMLEKCLENVENLFKALRDVALIVERKLNIGDIKFRLILVS